MRVFAAALPRQLKAAGDALFAASVPGLGRALFAARDLAAGEELHREAPLLAVPAPGAPDASCHRCLAPLAPLAPPPSAPRFCADACATAAEREFYGVERACDFSALRAACAERGEKFPLLAARLAAWTLAREAEGGGGKGEGGADVNGAVARGDPSLAGDLGALCFAAGAVEAPPPEWARLAALLRRGLAPLGLPEAATARFDLPWLAAVLARVHLNAFRVDTVLPLAALGPAALLRAAAGAAGGGAAQGAAVFALASLFNHSCAPTVDVRWPRNDAVAAFVAAADVPAHTQLTISYIDHETMAVGERRAALRFAYGFDCACERCVEEGGGVAGWR